MPATVFDSARPHPLVVAVLLGGCGASAVLGLLAGSSFALMLFLGLLAALFVWDLRPRRGPRETLIECRAGSVRARGLGTIRARDLIGATTAKHGGRVSLMLAHRRRKQTPIILDLPDEAALARVTKSLGIGYHGFGEVGAVLQAPAVETWSRAGHVLAIPLIVSCMVLDFGSDIGALFGFGLLTALTVMACLITVAMRSASVVRKVVLTPTGLFLPRAYVGQTLVAGGTFVPFDAIARVDDAHGRLDVVTQLDAIEATLPVEASPSWWLRKGLSKGEIAHVVSQIRAASARAHGNYVMKKEPETFTAQLRRAPGEGIREWLARLDVLSLSAAGYRGAQVDARDLWTILEDPEADPDLRGASARLLVHIAPEDVRPRVADVLATVRDDRVRARISASLDADVLEEEEREEQRAARRPA